MMSDEQPDKPQEPAKKPALRVQKLPDPPNKPDPEKTPRAVKSSDSGKRNDE
jgi:hypothetical protein